MKTFYTYKLAIQYWLRGDDWDEAVTNYPALAKDRIKSLSQ